LQEKDQFSLVHGARARMAMFNKPATPPTRSAAASPSPQDAPPESLAALLNSEEFQQLHHRVKQMLLTDNVEVGAAFTLTPLLLDGTAATLLHQQASMVLCRVRGAAQRLLNSGCACWYQTSGLGACSTRGGACQEVDPARNATRSISTSADA
jgi:hypothetical protein